MSTTGDTASPSSPYLLQDRGEYAALAMPMPPERPVDAEQTSSRRSGLTGRHTAAAAPVSSPGPSPAANLSSSPLSVDGSPTEECPASRVNTAKREEQRQAAETGGIAEEEDNEEEDAYDSCCICFDGKEFVLTSCCHLFCLPCITRWIEISGTCPICRNEFGGGVELYNLIGSVEDTVRAIKEVHKRTKESEKRKELMLAQQRRMVDTASSWGIFHQVMELLFPAALDGERLLGSSLRIDDDESTQQLARFNLTRVDLHNLSGLPSHHNVALAQSRQVNVAPSFPFLSFCCLPHASTATMPAFHTTSRGRIH